MTTPAVALSSADETAWDDAVELIRGQQAAVRRCIATENLAALTRLDLDPPAVEGEPPRRLEPTLRALAVEAARITTLLEQMRDKVAADVPAPRTGGRATDAQPRYVDRAV